MALLCGGRRAPRAFPPAGVRRTVTVSPAERRGMGGVGDAGGTDETRGGAVERWALEGGPPGGGSTTRSSRAGAPGRASRGASGWNNCALGARGKERCMPRGAAGGRGGAGATSKGVPPGPRPSTISATTTAIDSSRRAQSSSASRRRRAMRVPSRERSSIRAAYDPAPVEPTSPRSDAIGAPGAWNTARPSVRSTVAATTS